MLLALLAGAFLIRSTTVGVDVNDIAVPAGFVVSTYMTGVTNARHMTTSQADHGATVITYVGSTASSGNVWAVVDVDGDGVADSKHVVASFPGGQPNGVAWRDGSLYVAEITKIWRFDDADTYALAGEAFPAAKSTVVFTDLPSASHHGRRTIRFGPDGKIYYGVGAPCNVCTEGNDSRFLKIHRINTDGSGHEVVAAGMRNTVRRGIPEGLVPLQKSDGDGGGP